MTALLTALAVLAPLATMAAAAAQNPCDAAGHRVSRHRRTLRGDLRCLVGGTY